VQGAWSRFTGEQMPALLPGRPAQVVRGVALPHAQATAIGTLRARAADASRFASVLRDAHATRLASRLGLPLGGVCPRRTRVIATRSLHIDDRLRDHQARAPHGTVVELGAGFSTRFERIDNGTQRWLDIDLPPIVALRQSHLPGSPRRGHLAASITDLTWMDLVATLPSPHCFVLEAVLAYLPRELVPALLTRIARRFPGATLLLDLPRTGSGVVTADEITAWKTGLVVLEDHAFFVPSAGTACAAEPPYRLLRLHTTAGRRLGI